MNIPATREYKIGVIGSQGVGKTSLCLQFVRNYFPDPSQPRLEYYYRKQVILDGECMLLDIIDISYNIDEGSSSQANSIRQAHGFLLVYDVASKESFTALKNIFEDIHQTKGCLCVPLVLIGNKADLNENREVDYEDASLLAREWNCKCFEISAKLKINLDCAFCECVRGIKNNLVKPRQGNAACCVCSII